MKSSFYNLFFCANHDGDIVVFNTFSRGLVLVAVDLARRLQDAQEKGARLDTSDIDDDELSSLIQSGIVVPDFLDEIARFRYAMNRHKYRSSILLLFVSLTSRCNFACPYCYEDERESLPNQMDMSRESWRVFFDFLRGYADDEAVDLVIAALYGGEPLMNYGIALQAASDLQGLSTATRKVAITLITNGSLVSEERLAELAPLLNSVQITLDGPPDVQNRTRPYKDGSSNSYRDVLRGLRLAMESSSLEVILRVNVGTGTVESVSSLLRSLSRELPISRGLTLSLAPVHTSQRAMSCGQGSLLELPLLRRIAALHLEAAQLGYRLGQSFIPGPCMVSFANSMTVDESLNVYRCPGRVYERPDAHVAPDSTLDILRNEWYTYVEFEPPCAVSCRYAPICYGGCRWKAGSERSVACPKPWLEEAMEDLVLAYLNAQHSESLAL